MALFRIIYNEYMKKSFVHFLIPLFLLCLLGCECIEKIVYVKSNTPVQVQFNNERVVYVIEGIVNLRGDTVYIPANSKLRFKRGGRLTNGIIVGSNTLIEGSPNFEKVRLKGTFANQEFKTTWSSQHYMSDYIEDVMNLSDNTEMIVDCDITLNDQKKFVNHLTLKGESKTITNSDRFYITYGGTEISNLSFRWNKTPVVEPKDNYSAVVVYFDMLLKDTTIVTKIENVDADGGRYCSYFMRQYKSGIEPMLRTINTIQGCNFRNFTMGAIWTCGGSGRVRTSIFTDIGYEKSSKLRGVTALRLGYVHTSRKAKALGYVVEDCLFKNIVAVYNLENDGRGLHGLLAYGDSIVVRNNTFSTLSTSFSKPTDTGMDSEMLYIKGSYNTIEGNIFENGAGEASDGVVTLKVGTTEGNVVRNNQFLITNNTSKFIYLGGCNHLIEGNNFVNSYFVSREKYAFGIYLGHRDQERTKESVIIRNNTFSFTGKSNYMAIYAYKWGNIILENNIFLNPTVLIKYDKRYGEAIIRGNSVTLQNVKGNSKDCFIMFSGGNGQQVSIINNEFLLSNSFTGKFVQGSNYCFNDNIITMRNSSMEAMLRGTDTRIEAINNSFLIDENSKISNGAIVAEPESQKIRVENNTVKEGRLNNLLRKR